MNFTLTSGTDAEDLTIAVAGSGNSSVLISSIGTGIDAIGLDATAGTIRITASDVANAGNDDIKIYAGNVPGGRYGTSGNDIEITAEDDTYVQGGNVYVYSSGDGFISAVGTLNINDSSSDGGTIDIGGVTTDLASTISIATEATSADTISIGNTHTSTTIALTGGNDWSVSAGGIATFTLNSITSTSNAICHATNGTQTEALRDCNGGAAADYAERYPAAEDVQFGHIVVPGDKVVYTEDEYVGVQEIRQAVLSSYAYQGPIIGIASNNYSDFTSAGNNVSEDDHPMPIALVGRVPVKVVAEGGSISVGDFLTTSSTPGAAMKATEAGRVIGMALADWNGVSDTVMVQVINTWYQPPVSEANEIQGGNANSVMLADSVSAADGNFSGSVTVAEHLYGSHDMAGRVRLASGKDKVIVTFEKPFAEGSTPIITFSSRSNSESADGAWVSEESTTGFTINRSNTEAQVEYNWIAIGVYDAQVTVADENHAGENISVNDTNSPSAPAPVEPSDEEDVVAPPEAEEVADDEVVEALVDVQPAEEVVEEFIEEVVPETEEVADDEVVEALVDEQPAE